ncbi:MAG: alanine racemase [Treponema sp.]|nr:alanine racemase [Treponema sp.]
MRGTRAYIFQDNLRHNLGEIKKHLRPGTKICLAVKADAYGHNAVAVAKIAQEFGADFLAVATVDEGIELRERGVSAGIILLSLCTPQEMPLLFEHRITPLVFSQDYIKCLSDCADSYFGGTSARHEVHLAVDTGMGRLGCLCDEAAHQAEMISSSPHLALGGMMTHFALSDGISSEAQDFTRNQYDDFVRAVQSVRSAGISPGICSCANSAALLAHPEMHFDMVRPGIIAYGYYPDEVTRDYLAALGIQIDLRPVLSFESEVLAIRRFPAGKSASYGRTWTAPRETDIAVLPVGYADGLLRRFSPGVEVTINGRNYPVVGRICMDQCMVDIGRDNPDVRLWDRAVIFGPKESGALHTADDLAVLGGTISYEVLTSISKRVGRYLI